MLKRRKDDIVQYAIEPRLELIGSSECVVDGLKGICEYNHDKIRINLGKFFVTFYGDELWIDSFSPRGAIVQGTIVSVEFDTNA